MYKILIVDDDKDIVSALDIYLRGAGYDTALACNGQECLDLVAKGGVDLILMDVMMPKVDGLTAKSEDADKILGLDTGADDYVTKPFNPVEVLARVKSQLRRYTTLGGQPQGAGEKRLVNGGGSMDDAAKTVTVDGEPVALTPIEYNILKLLLSHPGQVFSTGQIYEQVWNDPALGSENTVAVHIRHLREKLEIDPGNPRYIKVVWGLGYKMERAI